MSIDYICECNEAGRSILYSVSGLNAEETAILVPKGINEVAASCCERDQFLTAVTVPSCVLKIDHEAFFDCHRLISVKLSNGLREIERYAFSRTMLLGITIPDSVEYLGIGAFAENKWMREVILPRHLYNVIKHNFYNYFPRTVTNVKVHNLKQRYCDGRDGSIPEHEIISISELH